MVPRAWRVSLYAVGGIAVVVLILAALLDRGGGGPDIALVNDTDVTFCRDFFMGIPGEARECNSLLEAHETVTLGPPCPSDEVVGLLLTSEADGQRIYENWATCDEWDESTVTIVEANGRIEASDDLPPRGP